MLTVFVLAAVFAFAGLKLLAAGIRFSLRLAAGAIRAFLVVMFFLLVAGLLIALAAGAMHLFPGLFVLIIVLLALRRRA